DKQCLNRVMTGAVVGGPAYAARPYGGLNMPTSAAAGQGARGDYLLDLTDRTTEPLGLTAADELVKSTESQPAAKPMTPSTITNTGGDLGAPVSLWDTDWPHSGYYWTVVGVSANFGGAQTTLSNAAPKGSTTVSVSADPGFVK